MHTEPERDSALVHRQSAAAQIFQPEKSYRFLDLAVDRIVLQRESGEEEAGLAPSTAQAPYVRSPPTHNGLYLKVSFLE